VARLELRLAGGAELHARTVGALDPVATDRTRLAARKTKRWHAATVREDRGRHLLAEPDPAHDAVTAPVKAAPTASPADAEGFDEHGETPLQHFRIGETRIRHVRMHGVRAVEVGTGARAPADGLVILVTLVAEREVVHRAL